MTRRYVRDFIKDSSGGVLIYTAFASAIMFGMVGLSLELGLWYQTKRDMQSAADAAALTAVLEMARGATAADIEIRAKDVALLNGYDATEVTINSPPLSGPYTGNAAFIEAIVAQTQPGLFSSVVTGSDMPIMARAVGTVAGASSCVLALNPAVQGALTIAGNTAVELDCGAQSNSTADPSIQQVGGSASLTATSIQSSGASNCDYCSPTPTDGMPQAADPFAYLVPPTIPVSCTETLKLKINVNTTLDPGYYCGGIEINGGTVTFNEGTYILAGVGLRTLGNAHLRSAPPGDGQTFYITSTATGQAKNVVFIAGTVSSDLRAPTTGPYDGILFYADPGLDPTLAVALNGGADMELTGVIYSPSGHVDFNGNSSASDTWTSIVSDTIKFSGSSYLGSAGFGPGGGMPLALTSPSLAE